MDVVAAAEAAMEALAPPPASPVTVFPEVEVCLMISHMTLSLEELQ